MNGEKILSLDLTYTLKKKKRVYGIKMEAFKQSVVLIFLGPSLWNSRTSEEQQQKKLGTQMKWEIRMLLDSPKAALKV